MVIAPPIRVGIVGIGRRYRKYYEDVLRVLVTRGAIRVVGCYNRTLPKAQVAAERFGTVACEDLGSLLRHEPDAVLNLVKGDMKEVFAGQILSAKKHLFLETPAASSSRRISSLLSESKTLKVQVAEDFAFFPEAQLQSNILSTGVLGPVRAVINDESGYAYHGFARLQSALKGSPLAKRFRSLAVPGYRIFCIGFGDGVQYIQRFPVPKDHASRSLSSWKIVGNDWVMDDDGVVLTENGGKQRIPFRLNGDGVSGADGSVKRIAAEIRGNTFVWEADAGTAHWSRKKQSLFFLLKDFIEAIQMDRHPVYGLQWSGDSVSFWRISKMLAKLPLPISVPGSAVRLIERILP